MIILRALCAEALILNPQLNPYTSTSTAEGAGSPARSRGFASSLSFARRQRNWAGFGPGETGFRV